MRTLSGLVAVLALALALSAGEPGDGKKGRKVIGKWEPVEIVVDGKKVAPAPETLLEVRPDGAYVVTIGGKLYTKGQGKGDESKTPHESDIMPTEGPNTGLMVRQIYKVEGGRMTVNAARPGDPRPKNFTSEPGSGQTLSVWRRVKD